MGYAVKRRGGKIYASRLGLLYIFTMVIAEVHQAGLYSGYYLTPFFICAFWFGIAILKYLGNNSARRSDAIDAVFTVRLFMIPWVVFIVYNIFLYVFGVGYKPFFKSSFVQIMFTPCILLGAWGAYSLFKENTLHYLLYSFFIHYVIILTVQFFTMGPLEFFNGIFTVFEGMSMGNPFETNSDMVLALGLLSVFYIDSFVRKESQENTYYILVLLLVLLGGKRIEILAILGIAVADLSMVLIKDKHKYRMQLIISLIVLVALFVFVYLVISGSFSMFMYTHGINTMGRLKMWDYVAQYVEFSPGYLGKGYSFSNLILEINRIHEYNGHVYVLHSDVLKIFFDLGFVMFSFWGIYNLFFLPKAFRKKYGYRVGNLCWRLMIFIFVLYITDNAINYFITQTVLLVVMTHSINLNKKIEMIQTKPEL